jgi:uncharacterized delta-60 repeat protein
MKNLLKSPLNFLLIFMVLLIHGSLTAQPGALDPGFGNSGKLTLDFSMNNDEARDVAIQSDGKILVAGKANVNFVFYFAVIRLNADGTLDNSFGDNGKVLTSINDSQVNSLNCMALQSDGKIILGGSIYSNNRWQIALVRLNSDGTLDETFSSDGVLTHSYGANDFCTSVAVQADGKIVVGGDSGDPGLGQHFSVSRFNTNGTIDASFGGGSQAAFVGVQSGTSELVIQTDGKIVLAGRTNDGVYNDVALVRFTATGSLDTGFDGDGIRTLSLEEYDDYATKIVQLPGGKLLVGGISNTEFALMRFNANGALDNSFSGDGIVKADMNDTFDELLDFTLDSDGRIVAVGHSLYNLYDIAVLRFNANGTFDNLFSLDGKTTVDFTGTYDYSYGVALQQDGKIVVVGSTDATDAGNQNDFAILRFKANCDVVVTQLDYSICEGSTVTVGGTVYNTSGNYTNTLVLPSGCDSIVNTSLTVLPNSNITQNLTIDAGQSVVVGKNTYTSEGVYTDILVSANGCDSVVTTNLTVNTGIGNVKDSEDDITVWPSPFTTEFSVNNLFPNDEVILLDFSGRPLMHVKATSQQLTIPTSHLPNGNYTLIHWGKRSSSVLKLLKVFSW